MAKPKLRFPEFTDEWEEIRLKEVVNKVGSGKTPKGGATVYQNKGIMLLRSQNVQNGFLDLEDIVYISDEINQTMKNSNVKTGDLLFNITGASIGRCCIYLLTYEANVNQHVCIIRLIPNENVHFYMQYILTRQIQNQIPMLQTGGGREGLNFESVKAIKLYRPNFNEQKKLAEFLSSVDTVIKVQEEKVSALEEQKKGVMQKLFNREVRFKTNDGNEYPEWEEKNLNQEAVFLQGLTYKPENVNDKGILVLRSSNIQESKITYDDNVYVDIDVPELLRVKENDILMCVRNGSKYLVGKTAIITQADLGHTWGAFMMIIRSNENNKFIYYYLNSESFNKQMFKDLGTSTINQITKGMLNNCKFFVPCLEEQQKIADCLSAYDDAIQIKKDKQEIWKEIKKGLLQQMFV